MNNIHLYKIKNLLSSFNINSLSIATRFKIRDSGKISASDFVASFFILIMGKCFSQRQWAITLSCISNKSVSFQAIAKRLNSRTLIFVKALIAKAILKNESLISCFNKLGSLSSFNRILVEDSTCIQLPKALFSEFPGSTNQFGKDVALARIQLCVDLKSGNYINYDIKSFRDNDCTYAANILQYLQPKDLVIRDLGYSANKIFNQISEMGAFYIARFRIKSCIYSPDNQEPTDLVKVLKKVERQGRTYFESNFILGAKEKLNCRVICIKLTPEQLKRRKQQIKKNGNRTRNSGKKTIYLQKWNILITNINKSDYCGQKIYQIYSLRWHIELIFKTWKSYFRLDSIMQSCQGPNRIKPKLLLYLCLCFVVIVVNPQFKKYQTLIYNQYKRFLSPIKFMKTILNNNRFLMENNTTFILELIYKNCCYSKRKDRINTYEKIIYL